MAHAPDTDNEESEKARAADRLLAANAADGGTVGACEWCGDDVSSDQEAGYMMWARPEKEDDDVFCSLYHMLLAFDDECGTNISDGV